MYTPKTRKNYVRILFLLFGLATFSSILHVYGIYESIGPEEYHHSFFSRDFLIGGLMALALGAQLILFIVLVCLATPSYLKHNGQVSVLSWNKERPIWSVIWTAGFIIISILLLSDALRIFLQSPDSNYTVIGAFLQSLTVIFMLLLIRAEVTSPSIKSEVQQ